MISVVLRVTILLFLSFFYSPQYSIGYCQQEPHNVKWTLSTPKPPLYFNAGMFVFQPSKKIFDDMMKRLRSNPPTLFAEQVKNSFRCPIEAIQLSHTLDLIAGFSELILWKILQTHSSWIQPRFSYALEASWKLGYFKSEGCTLLCKGKSLLSSVFLLTCDAKQNLFQGSKPWRFDPTEENMDREDVKMLVKKWWDIFESPTLALPSKGDIRIDSLKARVGVSVQAS